jgi:curved DNA-binding protein CbpA
MAEVTDKECIDALKAVLVRVADNADHFAMLGVEQDADVETVRDAFFKLARVLHPDLPAFKPPALRADATKAFQAIAGANKTLTDNALRNQYLSDTGIESSSQESEGPNPDLAHIHMHRARQLIARRDWAAAEEGLSLARSLFGEKENPECQTMLGWAILNNPQRTETDRNEESKKLWEDVLDSQKVTSAEAQAAYYMALWCKLNGEMPRVKKFLDRCLKAAPRHIEAQRELRLYDRRRASRSGERERPERRSSKSKTAAAAPKKKERVTQKVKLQKKKSWLEKFFGK